MVGVLSQTASDSTNRLYGLGFERFPFIGTVRLEDPDNDAAELRHYTTNQRSSLTGPIGDTGAKVLYDDIGTSDQSMRRSQSIGLLEIEYD